MSTQERPEHLQETMDEYPLLALKSMVVFPRSRATLAVAREKSVRAIEEAMKRQDRALVAVSQHSAEIDQPQPKDLFLTGTLVEISTMHQQQDGSLQVLLNGVSRVHIEDFIETEPLMRVRVSRLQEAQVRGSQSDALVRSATSLFERYAQLNRRYSVEDITSIVTIKTPARLADMMAAHVVTDAELQQNLLETLDPLQRLENICVFMGNEIEILELESTIRSRVRSQMDRTQKEFYLREQLRAIQEELGIETMSEAEELREKLKNKNLPSEVSAKVRKEIDRLEHTPAQSAEVAVLRSYIDCLLALPWTEHVEDRFDLEETQSVLDADHYGLESIKERIIEFLAVRQLRSRRGGYTSESQGQILCFIGPPGVGKTSLASSIARALGRPFVRISLGGVHDEAEIRGHRRTYVGALPGRIIQSMKSAGVRNPVFLLDEVDKLSDDYRGDPSAALLEVLDPQQNRVFVDHYLEIPFDLSEVFFICTGNVKYQIPRPLVDRMDIIELPGYIFEEKVNIGLRHLLPKVLIEHGLSPEQVKIPQSVMEHIVLDYTREPGVRTLERQLAMICRKVARRIVAKPKTHVRLTVGNLEQYLGAPRYSFTPPVQKTQIGMAMGLAVTESGGILLPVEVATMVGKGELLVTGQLGDVMRESAMAALSYIRSRADDLGIDPNFQDSTDLHIHLPENAIPKDGPSAGITIAAALISAMTDRPVRAGLAMTGEITLRGRVLGIGGFKEKVLAAHQAQITNLIAPAENRKEVAEIPEKIRRQMHFTFVDTMDDVIDAAFLNETPAYPEQGREAPGAPSLPLERDERLIVKHEPLLRGDESVKPPLPTGPELDGERDIAEIPPFIPPPDRRAPEAYQHMPMRNAQSNPDS